MSAHAIDSTSGRWTLTRPAFERLLAALDSDPQRAALEYERLRTRLIGLLRWWGAADADDLADRALDRVARKLEQGADVPGHSLAAYVRGVARMIYVEATRERARPYGLRHPRPEDRAPAPESAPDPETAHACLDCCLAALAPAERALVLRYYATGKKAEVRRLLARELGVSATALRIRTHRLRERLERCLSSCLANR